MKRHSITPRANWENEIKKHGFLFYKGYYNESSAYEFTAAEVDRIEAATAEIFDRCLDVVQHVIDNNLWKEFHISEDYAELIKWSWENDNPAFYGRFDLAMNEDCTDIKLLEFNADTPTSLLEASVIQWYWLQDFNKDLDQFNSIHEKLVEHMKVCKDYLYGDLNLWFSCVKNSDEDMMTTRYLQDCADQAGIKTDFLYVDEISVQDSYLQTPFCTPSGKAVHNLFKLYPWEWMFHEKFGTMLAPKKELTLWIEPPYKAILSNKMLLVYLHKLFPGHANILPAYYSTGELPVSDDLGNSYVRKPVLGREGGNVTVTRDGLVVQRSNGEYGEEGYVFQKYFNIPRFYNNTPVIGSWLIGGIPAGMGIKETEGLIHSNMSKFIPHYFPR